MSDALIRAAERIAAIVERDPKLGEPGTVVYTRDHVSILPENWGAPVTSLLMWASHLDGPARYEASAMVWDEKLRPSAVRATGLLNGVETTISVSTPNSIPSLRNAPGWQNVSVTAEELHELANDEQVVTYRPDRPNRSEWTSAHTWRDPDCIECGGEGAPCCDPPDTPVPAELRNEQD